MQLYHNEQCQEKCAANDKGDLKKKVFPSFSSRSISLGCITYETGHIGEVQR